LLAEFPDIFQPPPSDFPDQSFRPLVHSSRLIQTAFFFCPRQIVKLLGSKRAEYVTVFSGEDVKRRKPAPDVYQLAQIKFGVNPEDCVVFEDNGVGLQSAKAARMLCVISKSKYTATDTFPEADAVVDDLESGEINLERVAGMAFNMQGLNA
jgi:hypothetical protein